MTGVIFDLLFWRSRPGISVLIFAAVAVAILVVAARSESVNATGQAVLALVLVIVFSATPAYRTEPLTVLSSVLLAIGLLIIADDSLSSKWLSYGSREFVGAATGVAGDSLSKGAPLASDVRRIAAERERSGSTQRTKAVLRGALIAAPIILVLLVLLISADAIFADRVKAFFRLFRFGRLPDYAAQALLIGAISYLSAGVLVHAIKSRRRSDDAEAAASDESEESADSAAPAEANGNEEPALDIPPSRVSLGLTEALVVLTAVDALFVSFVAIQFRYFFGGRTNVIEGSLTYAEYARRGFFELVIVALISITLLMVLGAIARQGSNLGRVVFVVLRCLLVILVIVILASAFRRLLLYESAFGFSRLRTYTHVFIVWLAIFMIVVLVVQIAGRRRLIALGVVWVAIGFCATIAVLNVDSLIARKNVDRAREGQSLDANYLAGLSTDAVPSLFADFDSTEGPTHAKIGAALVCIRDRELTTDYGWPSANLSMSRARELYATRSDDLAPFLGDVGYRASTPRAPRSPASPPRGETVHCAIR